MSTLYYADEVRAVGDIPELPVQAKVHPNEKKMAMQLIEGLIAEFKPADYRDDYREALQKVIAAKVDGETVAVPTRKSEKVVDLMEALRRSLQMNRREKAPASRRRPVRPSSGQERTPRVAAMHERHR
jgi:DNA end-binding protein Ku